MHAGCEVYNLGTGKGTSVLEMVAAFEKVSGKVKVYINHASCMHALLNDVQLLLYIDSRLLTD
jgi:nucleoside-diphosphate-sugar epimerase